MSMAYGFYWGVFYPVHSPPYEPPGGGDDPAVAGNCLGLVQHNPILILAQKLPEKSTTISKRFRKNLRK